MSVNCKVCAWNAALAAVVTTMSAAPAWAVGDGTLALIATDCEQDQCIAADNQIIVELWMDAAAPGATGFQAFIVYDQALLNYNCVCTEYTANPFGLVIIDPCAAEYEPGRLVFAANTNFVPPQPPAVGPFLLVTIAFTVKEECEFTTIDFDPDRPDPFNSELSFQGDPIATKLVGSDPVQYDFTDPVISCPLLVESPAELNLPSICATSDCCQAHPFPSPGCSDAGCQATVCLVDPYCCDTSWDGICAGEAIDLCTPAPGPYNCEASDCCEAHPFPSPGCSDAACEATVCLIDPYCCDTSWDGICADEAVDHCGLAIAGPCEGAIVDFTVTATDNCDHIDPVIVCTPPSGSFFPVGTTTVTCTATDKCGNTDTCFFDVVVEAANLVSVDVTLHGIDPFAPAVFTQCIHFVDGDCNETDVVLTFTHAPLSNTASASGVIELPCGALSTLCAKDEQHTKWDTSPVVRAGLAWAAAPFDLLPGDDDNDGDVDINDVTWLVFTFGDPAIVGACPPAVPGADRDADFGHSGAVGTQDYSSLTGQFLTASSCACMAPALGDPEENLDRRTWLALHEIDPAIRHRVDLNGDGVFDAIDVTIFEMVNALPNTLSRQMLKTAPK